MRALATPALLITLALAGCGRDAASLTAPPNAPALAQVVASADNDPRPRPLAGDCETVLAPPQFIAPGVIRQVDTGTCQLGHLGYAAFYSDKLLELASGTQTMQATFTAANGDVLRAVGAGTNAPSGPGRVRFTALLTFVGGTGRFASATGNAQVEGEADLVGRRATLTLEGWVTYDASDRRGQ